MDIKRIQAYLIEHDLDGWLMADFHARNDIAVHMLELSGILTRRSFYFVPAEGEPSALVNVIEREKFRGVQGRIIEYTGYRKLESELKSLLAGAAKIAMEYSPQGRLPYIGLVDAGTVELVRGLGVEIVSSADLVAHFLARLSPEQVASHHLAARNLIEIKELAFEYIADNLRSREIITEYDVCSFVREQFTEYDMTSADGPICAVDAHAGDPHYEPSEDSSATIEKGRLILIDMWAKMNSERSVYSDITWMGFAGTKAEIPARHNQIFSVLVKARDEAVSFLQENLSRRPVRGCEVDDVCRGVVKAGGYGEYFTHRTGHSITTVGHGSGPNIDNLETEDKRQLREGHLFSIEPGIYMPDCGFRTEINVLVTDKGCEVTTLPLQTEILPLF